MYRRRLLTPYQRKRLLSLPGPDDLPLIARFHTFSAHDLQIIQRQRGDENRLGYALILALLRYPGYPLRPQQALPDHILGYIAGQIKVDPAAYESYAQTRGGETRREHIRAVRELFGFRAFSPAIRRQLSETLFPLALSTARAMTLVETALEQLRRWQIMFPKFSTIEDLCAQIYEEANESVYHQLTGFLTPLQQHQVLLTLEKRRDPDFTTLGWLKQPPGSASPANFQEVLNRLVTIRRIGLPPDLRSRLHPNRLDELYQEGKRFSAWRLEDIQNDRRSLAILVAFLIEQQAELTDQALAMHIQLAKQLANASQNRQKRELHRDGRTINRKLREYSQVGRALITAHEQGQNFLEALTGLMSWAEFVASIEKVEELVRPADFDFLAEAEHRYTIMRQYSPQLWSQFDFEGGQDTAPLRRAIRLLRELDQRGEHDLPTWAPTGFISKRWRALVVQPDGSLNRVNYELCALTELSHRLSAGDIWLSASKQFRALSDYLIPDPQWEQMKSQGSIPLTIETDFSRYICARLAHLHERLVTVDTLLSQEAIADAQIRNGRLHLARSTDPAPADQEAFTDLIYSVIPFIKITDLLLEVDATTRFTRAFTHLQTGEVIAEEDRLTLLTALLAEALNLGFTKMAEAVPGISESRLYWVRDWYLREDTYQQALAVLVNYHHQLPLSQYWGTGALSSSDARAILVGRTRSDMARFNPHYGTEASIMFLTHLSDQYAPYYNHVITSNERQASYIADGILHHGSTLPIVQHTADTLGYTDHLFAILHGLGIAFAPRIRNFHTNKLYTGLKPSTYPTLEPLIGGRLRLRLMETYWDDYLRLLSSIKLGAVSTPLILHKLSHYPRLNNLAKALREFGRLDRTLFSLDWIQIAALRQTVNGQLLKGERTHGLNQALSFHREGKLWDRSLQAQQYRASGLNLVTMAIVLWNTVYLDLARPVLDRHGVVYSEDHLRHLSPLQWGHIGLTGDYVWRPEAVSNLHRLRPLKPFSHP